MFFFSVPDLGFDDNLVSRKAAFDRALGGS